ncbi:MAG: translation elongation factor Ts [Candidatus Gracilibacteria bacterium]|jgi:elongation factor Ts|nr:translation elongation factor Ts [Candidatus Gracilibacteria bacterium]
MAEITAKSVMALREKTGVSMMACKEALVEAQGDEEAAIKILREKGMAKAAKKADRETKEGAVSFAGKSIISLNCETDFVANNQDFKDFVVRLAEAGENAEQTFEAEKAEMITKLGENISFGGEKTLSKGDTFGGFIHFNSKVGAIVALEGGDEELAKEVAMHIVATNPLVLSPADIDQELLAKEKEIWQKELENSGKPEKIWENIMQGKEKKFASENALVSQGFVKDPSMTIEQLVAQKGAKVVDFIRMEV